MSWQVIGGMDQNHKNYGIVFVLFQWKWRNKDDEFLPVRVHRVDLDGIEQLRHAVNAKGEKLSSGSQIQFNVLTKGGCKELYIKPR